MPTAGQYFALLLGYFGLQIVIRLLTSSSLGLDEAEQLLFSQRWQWGYGPQPPLYTWLVLMVFAFTGPGILGLALLKNSLLFGIFALLYLAARRVLSDHRHALIASLCLWFLPQLSWEAQRELTHTVLVALAATASWWLVFELRCRPTLSRYLALGLVAGAGLLSNYSYLILLSALGIALACDPVWRRIVWRWEMLAAVGIMLVLILPHLAWVWQHPQIASGTARKFQIHPEESWLWTSFSGFKDLVRSLLPPLGILVLVRWLLAGRLVPAADSPSSAAPDRANLRLLKWVLVIMLGELILAIVLFQATNFRQRWFTPLLIGLPILVVAGIGPRLTPARQRLGGALALATAAGISLMLPARTLLAETFQHPTVLNAPFAELAPQLRPWLETSPLVVAENSWLAGNLRLALPGCVVLTPKEPGLIHPPHPNGALLTWDATRRHSPPQELLDFTSQAGFGQQLISREVHVQAPLKFHRAKTMDLGLAHVRNPSSETRQYNKSLEEPAVSIGGHCFVNAHYFRAVTKHCPPPIGFMGP